MKFKRLPGQRGSLQRTLLTAFLALAFVPQMALGLVMNRRMAARTTELVTAQFASVATLKEQEIQTLLDERRQDLSQVLVTSEDRANALYLLQHSSQAEGYRLAEGHAYERFRSVQRQVDDFAELLLVNREGVVVLSTDPEHRGTVEADQAFLAEGLKDSYVSPLLLDPESGETFLRLAEPVHDFSVGITRGVVVARLKTSALDQVMLEKTGLGETGETYLVSPQGQWLTPLRHQTSSSPPDFNTYGIQASLAGQQGIGQYRNYAGTEVIGYYRWLPEVGAGLLAEQARSEAFATLDRLTRFALAVAGIEIIVTTMVILVLTQRISRPIIQLAEAASRVASGDFGHRVSIAGYDEISRLAKSFNHMSIELQDIHANLEQKVTERTAQLETLHQVARALTSNLELEKILREILPSLSMLFHFDGATVSVLGSDQELRVFPFDSRGQAVIREGGLEKQPLDETATGHVLKTGRPLIRRDLPREATFDFDRHSIEMGRRSQIFVPMRAKHRVIGTLYIGSNQPDRYGQADVELLEQVAASLAVAIENARLYQAVAEAARTDPLTGLNNRRHFETALQEEVACARRYRRPLSLVMVDVDDLKAINDSLGHACGDQALRAVAGVLRETVREADVPARWGGDEFAVLLPETDLAAAECVAERVCQAVAGLAVECDGCRLSLTISSGVAALSDGIEDTEALLHKADQAMYQTRMEHRSNHETLTS